MSPEYMQVSSSIKGYLTNTTPLFEAFAQHSSVLLSSVPAKTGFQVIKGSHKGSEKKANGELDRRNRLSYDYHQQTTSSTIGGRYATETEVFFSLL
jgi:hypothetical protein